MKMGKKWNGFEILLIGILDLAIGICWYTVLNPSKPEEITLTTSVLLGAIMMFYTLTVLFANYIFFEEAIED